MKERASSALGFLCTVLALLLSGCRSPNPAVLRDHVVVADEDGKLVDPFEFTPVPGGCLACLPSIFVAADQACDLRRQSRPDPAAAPRKLLVHIHGGLNTVDSALIQAEEPILKIDDESWEDWNYPLFLVWPSGLASSVRDRLVWIRQGQEWKVVGPVTAPLVLTTDLATSVVRAPMNLLYTWFLDLGVSLEVVGMPRWFRLPTWRDATAAQSRAIEQGYRVEQGEYRRGGLAQSLRFLSYWATFPLKIATEVLFLDGVGRGAFNVMLRRARTVFYPPAAYADREDSGVVDPDRGAFAEFFRLLGEHVKSQAEQGVRYEITLVCHSMGAIVCNEALQMFGADLPIRRIVYMAPACSVRDGVRAVLPLLRSKPDLTFHVLTLHPIAEADEAQWYALDAVPRGSLLEWIDNYYSNPPHLIDRVMGKWVNILLAIELFEDVRERVHVRAFDCLPDGDTPTRHNEFNEKPFWRRSFWQVPVAR